MSDSTRIYVAGYEGMAGSATVRALQTRGHLGILGRTRSELDLTDQAEVRAFLDAERLDQIYVAAAKVGGIRANAVYPAEVLYQNLIAGVLDFRGRREQAARGAPQVAQQQSRQEVWLAAQDRPRAGLARGVCRFR